MNQQEKKRLQLLYRVCERLNRSVDDGRLCRLSLEQLQYINHRLGIPCYVEACPGSGKTEVVGIKAAYEFAAWPHRHSGIAVLTFTRNAAKEIRKRVNEYAAGQAARHPHFVGTIDSWLHSFILQPFAHHFTGYRGTDGDMSIRLIENDSRAAFLNNYRATRNGHAVFATEYYVNHEGEYESVRRNTAIGRFSSDALESAKSRFLRDGFATYQDAEYICHQILKKHRNVAKLIRQRFPFVIVDECQDLSDAQMCIFYELMKLGTALQLVGDLNQAIYEFRKVDPKHIDSFAKKQGFHRKALTSNYRSNQEIVDLCSNLVKPASHIRGCEDVVCHPSCILWQYTDESFRELPACFEKLVSEHKLNHQACCIVARGKSLLKRLCPQKEAGKRPVELIATALSLWYSPSQSASAMNTALNCVGQALSMLAYSGYVRHQTQYCPDNLSPMTWRIFLMDTLEGAAELFPFPEDMNWSQWAKKLKEYLEDVWPTLPIQGEEWTNARRKVRAPSNRTQERIADGVGQSVLTTALRITTIHDVKGETFEALLLVSAPDRRSQGGHFEHWLRPSPDNKEHTRFAYVACSRPKHLLVIATPTLNATQLKEMQNRGLVPQDMFSWKLEADAA